MQIKHLFHTLHSKLSTDKLTVSLTRNIETIVIVTFIR